MAGKIVLLDGYSLMYRAFHALQTPMSAPDGTPTNAVHGFVMMLLKVIADERPEGLAVAFDVHAPTLRAHKYEAYKATRKPMPDELRAQDPIIRELIGQMNLPILEREGYEADDVLGTVSAACEREGREAVLVTGDRDSFQLAGEQTTILYTKKGITDTQRVTPAYIAETYGVTPKQLIDVKGLMGDTSDNIPGVPGVGEKTALKLIQQYGSLEAVLDRADAEQKGKLRQRLMENRDLAMLSKDLATIDRAAPIDFTFDGMKLGDLSAALPRLRQLGMNAAARRLAEVAGDSAPASAPAPAAPVDVEELNDLSELQSRCVALAGSAKWFAIHVGEDFTLATDSVRLRIRLGGDLLSAGITESEACAAALPLLRTDCEKALYDVKSLPVALEDLRGEVCDVMLAAYALNPQRSSFAAEALCEAEGVADFRQHPASALRALSLIQREKLAQDGLDNVYRQIELPLAYVLRDMEREGFLVDAEVLEALGRQYSAQIAQLTAEIGAIQPARRCWNSWPRNIRSAQRFWITARCRSWNRPTSTPCWTCATRRAASTPGSTRLPRPRDASVRQSRTCKTSPSAPRWAGRSAARSSRGRAGCWWMQTILRSSCACWRIFPETRRCARPSGKGRTSMRAPRRKSMACRWIR